MTATSCVKRKRSLRASANEILNDRAGQLPVWIRPPKQGVEFYSGFSRAKLYQLAALGHIVSRSIRQPGQTKGTRLFLLSSILTFIDGCEPVSPRAIATVTATATVPMAA